MECGKVKVRKARTLFVFDLKHELVMVKVRDKVLGLSVHNEWTSMQGHGKNSCIKPLCVYLNRYLC